MFINTACSILQVEYKKGREPRFRVGILESMLTNSIDVDLNITFWYIVIHFKNTQRLHEI
jgi:hypothetical protein